MSIMYKVIILKGVRRSKLKFAAMSIVQGIYLKGSAGLTQVRGNVDHVQGNYLKGSAGLNSSE